GDSQPGIAVLSGQRGTEDRAGEVLWPGAPVRLPRAPLRRTEGAHGVYIVDALQQVTVRRAGAASQEQREPRRAEGLCDPVQLLALRGLDRCEEHSIAQVIPAHQRR